MSTVRRAAKWTVIVITAPFLFLLVLGFILQAVGYEPPAEAAASEPSPMPTATAPPSTAPAPKATEATGKPGDTAAPELGPQPNGQTTTVTSIIDGDTIDTSAGTIRIIGIDTPERGECNFGPASSNATKLAPVGSQVVLTAVTGKDDTDKYGRLLRYVDAGGKDFGTEQIRSGLAIARYDSRDGYGSHPKQQGYIALDRANAAPPCAVPATKAPSPASLAPAPAPTQVAPDPAPASAYYANCTEARGAGAAPLYEGQPGYRSAMDRDEDGVACE
jgi:endonuclease YncB( thermonuclease family)